MSFIFIVYLLFNIKNLVLIINLYEDLELQYNMQKNIKN